MINLTGYKLTFAEEFNTRSISLTGQGTVWADTRPEWKFDAHSDIGFGKSSFVDPASGYDPFKVADGALTITASPDATPYGYPGSWESGLIHTKNSFSQAYGYFEMRADLSDDRGAWDAFWLIPNKPANSLAGWQELDVVEHYGANNKGVYSFIHTTDKSSNPNRDHHVYSDNPAITSGYHTYGMEWGPTTIKFYVDGILKGERATPSDMHGPMYLVANLATNSDANVANTPLSMKIDYIRAYSNDPNAKAAVLDTVSAPDGKDPGLYGATSLVVASNDAALDARPPTFDPITPPLSSIIAPAVPAGLVLDGGSNNDKLHGKAGDDVLSGGNGRDELTGGAGKDALHGGAGDDVFWIDADDVIIDGGAGRDVLYVSDTRGASLNLTASSIEEAQGGSGNDVFDGRGSTSGLKIFGNAGDDALFGGNGRDELTGGAGQDAFHGGAGDDVFWIDADDVLIDGGAGRDVLYVSDTRGASLNLTASSIEEAQGGSGNDVFDGRGSTSGLKIFGKAGDDVLSGGNGRDELTGGDGNDVLLAGRGSDILTGGSGNDIFVFDAAPARGNVAKITDFAHGQDEIWLDPSLFTTLGGELPADAFQSNITGVARDAGDRIIFNERTGNLAFDADGNGSGAAITFATLSPGSGLAASDFYLF